MDYVTEAKALGFTDAALMPVRELCDRAGIPRVLRGKNLCGNYNVCLPVRPRAGQSRK